MSLWRARWPRIVLGLPEEDPKAPQARREGQTFQLAVAEFLQEKKDAVAAGRIVWETFNAYRQVGKLLCDVIGRNRDVRTLCNADLAAVCKKLSGRSPVSAQVTLTRARSIVGHIVEQYDLGHDIDTSTLQTGSTRERRIHRAKRSGNLYNATTIKQALDAVESSPVLCAACWLALNVGGLPKDIAAMPPSFLDLERGWLSGVRMKTGADRRAKLWPETIEALQQIVDPSADVLFATPSGKPLQGGGNFHLTKSYSAAIKDKAPGTFRWFRYTFSTIASELGDDHVRQRLNF